MLHCNISFPDARATQPDWQADALAGSLFPPGAIEERNELMKTRFFATALASALALAAATPVSASDSWSETTMQPLMAASLDAGQTHVLSYFQPVNGACRLTMMIAGPEVEAQSAAPTRVQITVEPGRAAYIDHADGKSSRFTCLYSAEAMNVVRIARVALAPAR